MGHYEISRAVDDLVRIFCAKGYSDTTIATHRRNIQRVVNLHYACGTQFYNPQIVEQYIAGLRESYESGRISRSQKNALVKSTLYVCEIATTGTIVAGAKVIPDKLSPYYRMILDEIQKSESWNEGLKRNIVYAAHTYFRFLADSNIQDVSSITENTIRCYIMLKASVMNSNSLNTVRRNLKHLHLKRVVKDFLILFTEYSKNRHSKSRGPHGSRPAHAALTPAPSSGGLPRGASA